MSLPPHRENDAKVEGRDPPEKAKGTMAPFRNLMGRLLKVKPEEIVEQQKLYDENHTGEVRVPKRKKLKSVALAPVFPSANGSIASKNE